MKLKKSLCILLAFIMLFLSVSCAKTDGKISETGIAETENNVQSAEPAKAEENAETNVDDNLITISIDGMDDFTIPDIGGVTNGFTVTGIYDLVETTGKYITFEHEDTGLSLAFAATPDTNRAFDIAFATRGENDKGVPHILEHSTVSGSEKYPTSTLFNDVQSKCYISNINASTYRRMTNYYASSLSDLQLTTLFDVYFDSVFHPLVASSDHIFKREGWRYELDSPESDLTVTGVVYNEMQGTVGRTSSRAYFDTLEALYSGSASSFNTGGEPEDIITLSYDELIDYYNRYYSVSNALIILYGDLDINYYLEKLNNEYLVGLEKYDVEGLYDSCSREDFGGVKRISIDMPAAADASAEDTSVIYYAIDLGKLEPEQYKLIELLASAFKYDSSPLSMLINERFPGHNFYVFYDGSYSDFVFNLDDANPEDADAFMDTVNEALEQILSDGFDETSIESLKKSLKRSIIFNKGNSLGVNFFDGTYDLAWALTGDPAAHIRSLNGALDFAENGTNSDLQELIKKYFINPNQAVLSVTTPVPGLLEENEQKLKDELAAKKASMTEEEIEALVAETKEFYEIEEANKEVDSHIDDAAVLTPDDLEVEYRTVDISDENKDGVRYLTADISSDEYVGIYYEFDSSVIPQEDLLDYRFLCYILGYTDTKEHSFEEIDTLTRLYSNSYSTSCRNLLSDSDNSVPLFNFGYEALLEDADKMEEIFDEILYRSDFSDYDRIRSLASEKLNNLKSEYNTYPSNVTCYISEYQANPSLRYNYYVSYFDYMKRLREIAEMDDAKMDAFTENLQSILSKLLNKNNLICEIYASKENQAKMTDIAGKFISGLSDEKEPVYTYTFEALPKRIAVKVSGTSNYNRMWASDKDIGKSLDASVLVASSIVDNDFLYPEMRVNRGCYGSYSNYVYKQGGNCYTYRDGNIKETYEYFSELPSLLREAEYTQEDIDSAIVQSYSSLSNPASELKTASSDMDKIISGRDEPGSVLRMMKEMKAATPECIFEFADVLEAAYEKGYHVTAGCAADIDANADQFDLIIDDLIK